MTFDELSSIAYRLAGGQAQTTTMKDPADDTALMKLTAMYRDYIDGKIDKPAAQKRKGGIENYWRMDRHYYAMCLWAMRLYQAVDRLMTEYEGSRSLEDADRLLEVLKSVEYAPDGFGVKEIV